MAETEKKPVHNADVAVQDSLGGMAKRLLAPAHLAELARRSAATLRDEGAEQLWRDVTFRIGLAMHRDQWQHRADIPTRRQLKRQKAAPLAGGPLVSIIVPLYNTPADYLKEMVDSVAAQTYPNWQLCLADASDAAHAGVGAYCRRRAAQDSRIVYRKLEKNAGIAGNTNAGFAMAAGEWLTLLDHDDVLYPNVLY